ncbi:MAG: amidase [Pseudomonadota bacterium]
MPKSVDGIATNERIRRGDSSALGELDAAIARMQTLNPQLNAVTEFTLETARQAAAEVSGTESPLAGVPTLLKDLLTPSQGDPAYQGNRCLKAIDHRYEETSAVAMRLATSGLVSIGRTHSPEFGCGNCTAASETELYGPTRNPWNTDHSPMGSSGGAAAAVASGVVSVAQATDGGGSIRMPASACGIVGLKPSRGRVSNAPAGEVWAGGCTNGMLARTVRDAAAGLDILSGAEPGDPGEHPLAWPSLLEQLDTSPGALRIGICEALPFADTAPDVKEGVRAAGALLDRLGHRVGSAHPSALDTQAYLYDYMVVIRVSLAADLDELVPVLGRPWAEADMENGSWVSYQRGQKISGADYARARERLHRWTRQVVQWWTDGYDVLVLPTLATPPPTLGFLVSGHERERTTRLASTVPYTPQFNVTGQPAISLPLHWTASGLPIGVQFVAAPGRDDVLITLAAQLEQACAWQNRWPPVRAED